MRASQASVSASAAALEAPGQGERLVDVLEADLDRDLLPFARPNLDLLAQRPLEAVGGVAHRGGLLGIEPGDAPTCLWLAGQLGPVLGLAHRPPVLGGIARQAAADIIAAGGEKRSSVALAELARLE